MTEVANNAFAPLEPARCTLCDREMTHYNTFISPTDQQRVVCWECLGREEKGFFAKRGFRRDSRRGTIVR
jgi:hypothetical protein